MYELLKSWSDKSVNKIVGGEAAGEGRYGYNAALFHDDQFLCSGVLVTPTLVFTTATCLENAGVEVNTVILGCSDLTSREDCEVITAKKTFINPNFDNAFPLRQNFAVVHMRRQSVQVTINIGIDESLVNPVDDLSDFPAVVMGWGLTDPNNPTSNSLNQLHVADMITINNNDCNGQYRKVLMTQLEGEDTDIADINLIDNTMFCAVGSEKGPCDGDEGGALILDCGSDKEDVLFGVYNFQIGCGYEGIPAIFTSATSIVFLTFLNDVMTEVNDFDVGINFDEDFCVERVKNPTPFPVSLKRWTCDGEDFATRNGCHCNCGIPDPDCQFESAEIFNCDPGDQCLEGTCTTKTPTNTPTSSPSGTPTGAPTAFDFTDGECLSEEKLIGYLFAIVCFLIFVIVGLCYLIWSKTRRENNSYEVKTVAHFL